MNIIGEKRVLGVWKCFELILIIFLLGNCIKSKLKYECDCGEIG